MDRQMKAEREKRATILEAEAIKQKDITVAEGKRDAMLMEAEAKAKSVEKLAKRQATKIVVPSDIASLTSGIVAIKEVLKEK